MKKFLLFISFCLLCLSQINAATETWVKVTEAPTDWSGDYLIVYEAGSKAFNGSLTKLDDTSNFKDVTISDSDNSISTTDCDFYFTIAAVSGGYTIQSKSGYYIGRTQAKNGLDSSTSTKHVNTISLSGSESILSISAIVNGNTSSAKLQYNATSGQTRFRYFTSSQKSVALYKKQEGEPTQVAKPTTTAADKMLYGTEYTISSAEGTTLYYCVDGTDTYSQAASNTVTLYAPDKGESFTIKAYAVDPNNVLTQSETLLVENIALYSNDVANIKAFLDAADTSEAKTFTNPVTAIYQNGKNLWVKDDSGYLLVYGTLDGTYAEGDVIPAGFSGKYTLFSGLPELGTPNGFAASTEKTAVTPEEVTVELLAACDLNTYVSIKNAKFDGTSFSDDGTNSIALGKDYSGVTFESGKTYDITGFYSIYNGTYQITVIKAVEKQLVADLEITPAFGNILIGETITISCATEGATIAVGEISGGAETIDLSGKTFPYTYTIKEEDLDKTLNVEAYASLAGYVDSPLLTGNYTVIAPTPAEAVFTIGEDEVVTGGDVKQGSYIKFSWESGCSAEVDINGTVTNYDAEGTFGTWSVDDTYKAGDEVTISVTVTNKYSKTSTATATFTVVNPYKVVDVITVDDLTLDAGYTNFSYAGEGAVYAGRCQSLNGIYINNSTDKSKNAYGAAFFMTESVGVVSKITLDVKSTASKKNIYVYGQYEPYVAYEGTDIPVGTAYFWDDKNIGTKIGESVTGTGVYTFDNPYKFNYIMIISDGGVSFNSITFEWEDKFEHGDDISYEMQRETTKLTEGKFITLVDATNGKAVSRNNAAEGTIAGAAASVEVDTENNKTSLYLKKGQFSIDEFELVPAEGGFKLYGGGSITRRYIGVDATGLTTTADATAAAVVTLESDGTGVVVKFADGEYIVSDGKNFGKGTASTEAPASLDESATLVPAYVFVSPGEDSTGVEDIEMVETEAPAQYYNLNGVEVKAGNLVPGIYIVRQGNKVSKQFIR